MPNNDDDDCRITFRSTQAEREQMQMALTTACNLWREQNEQMQVEEMPKMHTFMATMKEKRWALTTALTTALMTALSWAVWTGWRWAIRQHKLISPPPPPRRASLDIFISLRLDEAKEHARALKTAIEAVRPGVECFVSGDNAYGARIDQIISEAVVSCRLAVVMGTKTYGLPTASTFSTDQELQFILETPKPFFLVKMCDCFEVSTTQLKLGPRCGSIKYMEWLPGAPMPERLVAEILSTLDSCAEAGPASSSSAPLPSQLNAPRLLAVGCNIGLPAVDTELRAIEAALPSGWVVVERNPTAEKAASKTPALPCFHFCGHADPKLGSHRTLLWVKNGRPEAIDAPSLVQMLRRAELVVLNGCKSLALAEALAHAGVPNVVCWETLAHDDASSRFGVAFWKRVAEATQAGKPLRDAARLGFEAGELAVRSETKAGGSLANGALAAFTPRFALGIDPQDAALVKQAAPGRGRCLPAAGPDAEGRIAAGRPVLLQPQRPRGDLPAIPDHYALRPADAALRERLIKDGLQPISLVGGSRGGGGAAALAGTAGLGKSTLAAVVALDVRVQSTFHDGIFWLRFGQERRALDVLRELAGMIDVDISALREQQTAVVDAIARWLDTRRCLLILDDVWTPEQARPFTRLHAGRLLTTRLREVATRAGGRTQEMETLDPREALRLLAACMQTDADLSTDADAKELVRLSGGLPVMLEQLGAACRGQSISSFLSRMQRARQQNRFIKVEAAGDYEYDTFFAGMEVQLSRLEESGGGGGGGGSSAAERGQLYDCCCKLAVLPEDTEMPLSVAAMLWGVDEVDAEEIVDGLAGQNLVKRTEAGGRKEASLSLLDLHLQYLRHRGRNAIAVWHAALLRGWMEGCVGGMLRPAGYWRGAGVLKHHLGGAGSVILPESLTELDISGGNVDSEGAKTLASALGGNEVLKSLNLRRNDIHDEGAAAIADALKGNAVLTSLDVGFNNLTEEAALGIVRVERQRNKLTSLGLGRCSIGPTGTAEIAEYVTGSRVLTTLNIGYNKIGPKGAAAIAEAVRGNEVLTTLNLSGDPHMPYGGIGPEGAAAIAEALKVNAVLTELHVGSNQLCGLDKFGRGTYSAAGITALAEALKVNEVLNTINLARNDIGGEGEIAIADALRVNEVLAKLNLDGHELDLPKLRGTDPVESLDLSSKDLGPASAIVIASLIAGNAVLTKLVLWDNNLGEAGKVVIREAVSGRVGFELKMSERHSETSAMGLQLSQLRAAMGRSKADEARRRWIATSGSKLRASSMCV